MPYGKMFRIVTKIGKEIEDEQIIKTTKITKQNNDYGRGVCNWIYYS
jgi:hypothetical protein